MLWTRLWLLLLALVIAGLGLGAGLLYFDAEQRESQQRDVLWHKTQQAAELLLRVEAEQLIELATGIGSDATLASSIEEHERGLAEPALLRQSIGKRLRRLAEQRGLDFLMVVDGQGLVLTRVGLEEARHGMRSWAGRFCSWDSEAIGSTISTSAMGECTRWRRCR
jgi:uncharacterized protein HemX